MNGAITNSGIRDEGIRFLNTPWAVIGGLVYGYLAFMILPVYASLDRMDQSVVEAGKDLYGSAMEDVPLRNLASHLPGRPRRRGAGVSPSGGRFRERPAARRARVPTWSGT